LLPSQAFPPPEVPPKLALPAKLLVVRNPAGRRAQRKPQPKAVATKRPPREEKKEETAIRRRMKMINSTTSSATTPSTSNSEDRLSPKLNTTVHL